MSRINDAFNNLSIKKKLMLSYSVLVIVPIIFLMVFSTRMTGNIVLEKINNTNIDFIESTSKRVDRLLYDVTYTLLNISRSRSLQNTILSDSELLDSQQYNTSNAEFKQHYDAIQNIFENAPLSMLMLSSKITVLCGNGINYGNWQEYYKYAEAFRRNEWYSQLMRSRSGAVLWLGINKSIESTNNADSYMLEAAIPVKEGESPYSMAVVHLAIPEKDVYETIKSNDAAGSILLVDNKMNIISCEDKSLLGSPLRSLIDVDSSKFNKDSWYVAKDTDKKTVIVNMTSISKTGWKIVSISPYNTIMAQLFYVRNILILVSLLFIVSFLSVALLISKGISKPIIQLNRKMMMVEQGKLDVRVDVKHYDEVGNLSRNFNNMLDKVNELMKVIKLEEKLKRDAEFDALQAQINPHFLFNTLSSIRWAAAAHGDTKVEEMVFALSNILNVSISRGPEIITLKEEIAILGYYVDICKMRQGYSYELECNIEEDILAVKIPKLILQPIVENAILHGFEEIKSGGIIRISGKRKENGILEISVMDNGKGIDPELVGDILSGKVSYRRGDRNFSSIGIRNVNERIKLHFGEEFGLAVRNYQSGGTEVTLTLPIHKGDTGNV